MQFQVDTGQHIDRTEALRHAGEFDHLTPVSHIIDSGKSPRRQSQAGIYVVVTPQGAALRFRARRSMSRATSTVVPGTEERRLAESQLRKSPLEIGGGVIFRYQ